MKSRKSDAFVGVVCALGCEFLYGLSYLFTKQASASASALALLGWRFLLAFLFMSALIVTGLLKVNLREKPRKPLLLIAFFFPIVYFIGETLGIRYTTASEAGAFLASIPVAALVASTLILKRKPQRIQVIGIATTIAGVLTTVFAAGSQASFSVIGYLMLSLAVIAFALYSVQVEKAGAYTGTEITYVMLLMGAAVFAALALMEAAAAGALPALAMLPFTDRYFLTAVLFQGIGCSVGAFYLTNVAISKIGVNRMSSFIGVATVVSIAAGVLLLKEPFSVRQLIGVALIIAGVYIANLDIKKGLSN